MVPAFLEFWNCPSVDGLSQAQPMFFHRIRTTLAPPHLHRSLILVVKIVVLGDS